MIVRRVTRFMGPGLLGALVACQPSAGGQGGGNPGLGDSSSAGSQGAADSDETTEDDTGGTALPSARRRRLDVAAEHVGVTEDATVLVVLDDSRIEYDLTEAGGVDLRFFADDGTTALPAQIEQWDPDGTSLVWVRLSGDAVPDHFWMYYGDAEAFDPAAPSIVWDEHFEAIWHMTGSDASTMPDASGSGHDLSLETFDGTLDVPGVIGNAARFQVGEAPRNGMELLSGDALALSEAITIEAWVSVVEGEANGDRFAAIKNGSYSLSTMSAAPPSRRPAVTVRTAADAPSIEAGGSLGDDWTYVVATYRADEGTLIIARNGTVETSMTLDDPAEQRLLTVNDQPLAIGHRLEGELDEVRISSIARSSAWIRLQHASMTDTLLSFGPPEARPD
ncbi:MAG: DUF2341 domain-containing protein [Myxococcota bacterium]